MTSRGAAWVFAFLVGCASAPGQDRPVTAPVDASCDRARSASFVASGDLDGALETIAGCTPEPEILLQRMRALVELGEIARAKEIARSVGAAPPAVRSAADEVLALTDPSPSRADALLEARSSAAEGAKLAQADAAAAARAYGRARHLFERATGASSTRVAIEGPLPTGWSGERPLWSVTLRGAPPPASAHRFLLVTDRDETGALVPIAALDLGSSESVTPISWPRPGGGVMLASEQANTLWSAPWLEPLTLPAGKATFDPSGATLVIARGKELEAFETASGARKLAWPHLDATGAGAFVTATRYAEAGPNSTHTLVVDVAKGAVLLDEAEPLASAVSPSGKLVALLDTAPGKPDAMPRFTLGLIDLDAPRKPRSVIDLGEAPLMSGVPSVAFDGDRGVAVMLSGISAMMTEGSLISFSYVALPAKRAGAAPKGYVVPDRPIAFARIAKLAAPSLQAPRVAIEQWLHSQTVDEDRQSARAALVTGIPIASGFPSHVGKPSLVFIDTAAKKLVRDVPLPAAELTIDNVSIAPGGRSATVCAKEGPTFLVDATTGEVLPGSFACTSESGASWSADGERLIASSGVVTLHASGSRALVETPLPIADEAQAKRIVASHLEGPPPRGAACLIGTVLAPYDVCR